MLVRLLVSATIARTAVFALPVGLFLAAAAEPAGAPAVLATASALTIGSGLGSWPSGRVLDRLGRWRGLRASMLAGAGSLLLLAAVPTAGWSRWLMPGLAFASGVVWSPVLTVPRAVVADVVDRARLPWASGIEVATVEVALIAAPVVGAVAGRGSWHAVPATGGGLLVLAALLLPARVGRPPHERRPRWPGGARVLAVASAALASGLGGGLMEPGLAALPSPAGGWPGSNAWLFVAIGVGSALGGLMAARSGWPRRIVHSVPLLLAHAAALAAAAIVGGVARLVLLVVAGLPIAPTVSLAGLHLDRWSPATSAGEAFGLVGTALTLGTGLGQAVAAGTTGWVTAEQLVLLGAVPPAGLAFVVALRGR